MAGKHGDGSVVEDGLKAMLREKAKAGPRSFSEDFYERVIIETGDGDVIGIEVKAASSYSAKQFHGLKKI